MIGRIWPHLKPSKAAYSVTFGRGQPAMAGHLPFILSLLLMAVLSGYGLQAAAADGALDAEMSTGSESAGKMPPSSAPMATAGSTGSEKKQDMLSLFGSVPALPGPAAPLMTNIDGRRTESLNGEWNVIVDEHEMGGVGLFGGAYYALPRPQTGMELVEHSFDSRRTLRVPGDWNTQDERLFRYRGVVWYQRSVTLAKRSDQRYFLHFDGVNYAASVYLNGHPLASHKGGYTPFNVELTDALVDGDNFLVVRVDAHLDDSSIPTRRGSDFFKYGGITRDVDLVTVNTTFIRQYQVYLDDLASGTVAGWVQLDGPQSAGRLVSLEIAEAGVASSARTDANGLARFSFKADLALWSPERPKLYQVTVELGAQRISDSIGFRTIATRGQHILLNGKPVFLRGISMHDESFLKSGVAYDSEDAMAQLGLVKELHGNFVRLAHYPHNEHTLRMADELGLMVWSEIPIVSVIDWGNEQTQALALAQISDNVSRDLNRASVVMWSVANETMPASAERLAFLRHLAQRARALDASGRPVAAALVGDVSKEFPAVIRRLLAEMLNDPTIDDPQVVAQLQAMAANMIGGDREIEALLHSDIDVVLADELGEVVDVIGYNEYFGWYYSSFLSRLLPVDEGTVRRTMFKIMPDIRFSTVFDKPLVISETGAGARKDYESPLGSGMIWSEAYQARVYAAQVDMLSRNPAVQGMSPWVLKDFRSALRSLNGIQDTYNRKGLVSEAGEKKQAFFILRDFYAQKALSSAP